MVTPSDLTGAGQRDPGTVPVTSEQPSGTSAWLRQSLLARDRALRLFQYHFQGDLARAKLPEKNISSAFGSAEKCVTDLTADFLAESEKLFQLATNLAENDCLSEEAIAASPDVGRNLT